MANISKKNRDKMISFLEELKKTHNDDFSIKAFNEIENTLNEKKYGLVWEEHTEKVNDELEDKIPVFDENTDYKINKCSKNDYNFLLEGDNLHSLYLLEKTSKNSIDVIYIDPPYNTGNQDFCYNDDYVEKEDVYRHSKWLSFMNRRMRIAFKLLSKNGVMFISIDEHEIAQLMMLAQEIFGYDNVDYIIWQKTDSKVDRNTNAKVINRFKNIHETIIVCYKNKNNTYFNKMMKLPDWKNKQTNPDNDPRGPWSSGIISFEEGHKNEDKTSPYYYTITTPTGKQYTRQWYVSKEEFEKLDKDNRISYPRNGDGVPRLKTFENEEKEYYIDTILRGVGTSSTAKDELLEIFGDRDIFDTPKPTKMIKELIRVAGNKNSTILDFFAGSGTTGQAVLELNQEDNGNRHFILCTDNEIDENKTINYLEKNNYISIIPKLKNGNPKVNTKEYEQYKNFIKSNEFETIKEKKDYLEMGISRRVTLKRISTIIEGKENLKYPEGIQANLKYFVTKWVQRRPEDTLLSNLLLLHIKEMIELENNIEIDNNKNVVILNRDDYKKYIENEDNYEKIENIWVNQNIIFDLEELNKINKKNFKFIPREYFGQELKEAAE